MGYFGTLQLILSLDFEETMVCNDFIIELSEDFLVVINQFEELAGYGTQIVLANSKSWWDLWHTFACAGNDLLAKINNSLLKKIADSLVGVLKRFVDFCKQIISSTSKSVPQI